MLIDFGSARGEIASHSKTVSALVKPGYSPYEQYATTSSQQGSVDRHLRARRHALSRDRRQAPARCALAHGQRRVRAGPRGGAQLLSPRVPGGDRQGAEAGDRRAAAVDRRMARAAAGAGAQARSGRLSLGRALRAPAHGRSSSQPAAGTASRSTGAAPREPPSLVPAPPDAPQPKGQLLDFIEALKKRRPGLARQEGSRQPTPRTRRQSRPPRPPSAPRPAAERAVRPGHTGQRREPPPACRLQAQAQRRASGRASSARVPAVLARRAPPRPRRVRGLRMPSRRWRSLLYKLRSGSASPASPSPTRTSCRTWKVAAPASSRARPPTSRRLTRITGHRGAVTGARHRRPGALDRLGRRRRHAQGVERRLRRARAHHRARRRPGHRHRRRRPPRAHRPQGRRHRAVGPRARREARRSSSISRRPISALAFTGDADHFAAAGQAGAVTLFDIRTPSAPAAVFDGQDGAAQAIASARWSGLLASAGQDRSISCGGPTRAASRAAGADRAMHRARSTWRRAGARVASGSAGGSVRLWSTSSSRPQRSFKAHEGRVTSLAFAPNDRLLASAGEDGQVKLWDLRSGRSLACFAATPDRSLGRLLPGRPPRHLRRPGRHHPRLEHRAARSRRGSDEPQAAFMRPRLRSARIGRTRRWKRSASASCR